MEKNGILNDGLNEEQSRKRMVRVEDNDANSSVKRQRVSDQTLFDKMFIEGLISVHHHEAAHMFIDELSRSGSSIPSIDLSKINISSGRKGSSAAERRMIFSSSFRSIADSFDEEDIKIFMRVSNSPYDNGGVSNSKEDLEKMSETLSPILEQLAKYYKLKPRKDPREIIFSQMYRTAPKKHI